MTMPPITEKTNVTVRIGAIGGIVAFIAWVSIAVSSFMGDVRAFQNATTITLNGNAREILEVKKELANVIVKQQNVLGDRWKYSDQLPWAYELEKANRDVIRKDGKEGLNVPQPVPKNGSGTMP